MPGNDNILAQIATVGLEEALPDIPQDASPELQAWMDELQSALTEHMTVVSRSLRAVQAYVARPPQTIQTSYTATDEDSYIFADATAVAITISLPPAADVPYHIFTVKRLNSGANSVTIDADGSETIDGALTFVLGTQYHAVRIFSDGTEWWIF